MAYRQTVLDWFEEIWNKGNLTALNRFMTDETVFHSADGLALRGFKAFTASQVQLRTFFEKFECKVEHTLVAGNTLCATVTVKAVHRLSQKPVRFQAMNRVRFDASGKIEEAWDTIDWLTCLVQIGSLSEDILLKGLMGNRLR